MRFASVTTPHGPRLHVRGESGFVDVATATGDERLVDLNVLLSGGEEMMDLARRASRSEGRELDPAEYGPAVPTPRRILCLGVNYVEHALEGGRAPTVWPEVFLRGADSVSAPYGDLAVPALTRGFDYEGELAIVIGRGGRYIRAADALSAIAGFTIAMDGSAREWQRAASQWTPGKNFDKTMPLGPEVVTADEIDVTDLRISTILNGTTMQSASTAQMIFDVPRTVEFLSSFTTLRAGDVIATGTPGGVGFARQPPVWLTPGDELLVEVEGLGQLSNRIVAEGGAPDDWPWSPPALQGATF